MQPPNGPKWDHKFERKRGSWIYVPSISSRKYGNYVKKLLQSHWTAPTFYYHLRKGGHVEAIKKHTSKSQYFFNIDISSFFDAINRSRVTRTIKPYTGYSIAREIARSSTIKVGEVFSLPYGFIQSPLLASMCLSHSHLGNLLSHLDHRHDFQVSVYMDDIIVSGHCIESLNKTYIAVRDATIKSGFQINETKAHTPSQSCKSFNIQFSKTIMQITDERMAKFINAYHSADNQHQRQGILTYVGTVNPTQTCQIEAS